MPLCDNTGMRRMISLRSVINGTESYFKLRQDRKTMKLWKNKVSAVTSPQSFNANIMLTNNQKYVDLAEICVNSFIYFHPKSHFTLHCDGNTITYTKAKFSSLIQEGRVKIKEIEAKEGLNWQDQKLEIILSLSGTKQLMLDADLRWNGPLEINEGVTFFVEEFTLNRKSPFREIIKETKLGTSRSTMKNLSFFSFGGYALTEEDLKNIKICMDEYRENVRSDLVGKFDKASIERVIEQFVLSVCCETWPTNINFVKYSDKPKDGGIVESCYFGATGGTF